MEVVYQYSALTMGWCINCHREMPLNTKDNKYYDNLVKLHDTDNAGRPSPCRRTAAPSARSATTKL